MDGERFDKLARSLAANGATRRRVLAGLAAGLAGGFLAESGRREAAARHRRRRKDPCVDLAGPSFRTCGQDDQGNPICKDFLDRDSCGGCNTVCDDNQDCCLGNCRTRLTVENCDNCQACPAGDGWVCNPTLNDGQPGCDCVDEANCFFN